MPHYIEEKIDGSQFSFGFVQTLPNSDDPAGYDLMVRSKGAVMHVDAPERMFTRAVETAKRLASDAAVLAGVGLHAGWTYRAEFLAKKHHNALDYDRVPQHNIILFDVGIGDNEWLGPEAKAAEAARLGLECVPVLAADLVGTTTTLETLRTLLDTTTSQLGGQLIEGIVVKPLGELYGQDHKTLMGKFVSERFKEVHKHAWKESNPNSGDVLERLAKTYTTEARWMKALQHLREAGTLEDSPRDIRGLLLEVARDRQASLATCSEPVSAVVDSGCSVVGSEPGCSLAVCPASTDHPAGSRHRPWQRAAA